MLRNRLLVEGVEVVAIVASRLEHARLYLRHRPLPLPLAVDPDFTTHRAYGLPVPVSEATQRGIAAAGRAAGVDLQRGIRHVPDLPPPPPGTELAAMIDQDRTDRDRRMGASMGQPCAQVLVDRDGIIRWQSVECRPDDLGAGLRYPTDQDFLAAVRAL